jgi:hypothetical protein
MVTLVIEDIGAVVEDDLAADILKKRKGPGLLLALLILRSGVTRVTSHAPGD